jgi:hypothetical protein
MRSKMDKDKLIAAIRKISKERQEIARLKSSLNDYCRDIATNKLYVAFTNVDDLKTELEQILLEEVINGKEL